jgi:hypothetical protein
MARRQTEIPGTERTDVPAELLELGESYLELLRNKRRANEKCKDGKKAVLSMMQLKGHALFTLKDPETDEVVELELDNEPKLRTRRTGSVDSEIGDAMPDAGAIADAAKTQADAGVEEIDGDVVVPDKAAPKKRAKKGSRK